MQQRHTHCSPPQCIDSHHFNDWYVKLQSCCRTLSHVVASLSYIYLLIQLYIPQYFQCIRWKWDVPTSWQNYSSLNDLIWWWSYWLDQVLLISSPAGASLIDRCGLNVFLYKETWNTQIHHHDPTPSDWWFHHTGSEIQTKSISTITDNMINTAVRSVTGCTDSGISVTCPQLTQCSGAVLHYITLTALVTLCSQ